MGVPPRGDVKSTYYEIGAQASLTSYLMICRLTRSHATALFSADRHPARGAASRSRADALRLRADERDRARLGYALSDSGPARDAGMARVGVGAPGPAGATGRPEVPAHPRWPSRSTGNGGTCNSDAAGTLVNRVSFWSDVIRAFARSLPDAPNSWVEAIRAELYAVPA